MRRSSGAWSPPSWALRHGWASARSTTRSSKPQKEAAEKKKKTTITAESFDKQVAHKMGRFFEEVFLPMIKKLVEAGKSYDEVKRLVKIPSTWGAKISGEQFRERLSKFLKPETPHS